MKKFSLLLVCVLSFCFLGSAVADIDSGLVAHYKFDGNANDSSGNGNNGVENGGLNYATGKLSQAAYFDGSNDYISFPQSNSLDAITKNITIGFWLKAGSSSFSGSIPISKRVSTNEGMHFVVKLSDQYGVSLGISGATAPYPSYSTVYPVNNIYTTLNDGTWHHITLQHTWGSNSKTRIYLDGIELLIEEAWPYTNQAAVVSSNLMIGRQPSGYNFGGYLDELRIYNRLLSNAEIQELLTANSACTSAESGTVNSDLDIHMPSLNYETLFGTQNIWVDFEYYGEGPNGELLWKLKDGGVNQ